MQTANMYKKRLNNRFWIWIRESSRCGCKRRKGSLKQNFKSSCPSSHYKFPLVAFSVWYPAGLTQILLLTHFKLFLLKHFVHSYLNPSIGKLGFILDQEVPDSTENTFLWYSQQEIILIKKDFSLYCVPLSKDHIFPYQ